MSSSRIRSARKANRVWSNWFDAFWTADKREGMYATFMVGRPGHALHPDIEIKPDDMRINKFRFGTFVDGSSDLHQRLRARGIDTVIITGCATNICCKSTARDAMMLNYKVLFVSDATATHTDFEHNNHAEQHDAHICRCGFNGGRHLAAESLTSPPACPAGFSSLRNQGLCLFRRFLSAERLNPTICAAIVRI